MAPRAAGFSIWERRGGSGRNVTFPARQYSVNGERRSFALLRPIVDTTAQNKVRGKRLRVPFYASGTEVDCAIKVPVFPVMVCKT